MRIAFAVFLLMLAPVPGFARSVPEGIGPAATAESNDANWADWEAQARITDGDYDGAIQAQQQAETARCKADHQAMLARPSSR